MAAILHSLRIGNTRTDSALAAGISLGTLSAWCVRFPEFLEAVEKAEAEARLRYLSIIATAAETTWQAAAWWLERRRPDDYGRRDRVDLTVDVRALAEQIAGDLSPDEVLAEADRILAEGR